MVIPSIAHADPDESFAGWVWSGLTDEAHRRVGYGGVQWAMDVTRASDGATARLVQRDNSAVFISYGSKPSFFQDTNFGYTFMVNYVDFSMTKQSIPGDKFADLGTEVGGYRSGALQLGNARSRGSRRSGGERCGGSRRRGRSCLRGLREVSERKYNAAELAA